MPKIEKRKRPRKKLRNSEINRLFALMSKQSWLAEPEQYKALIELMRQCKDIEEQLFLSELLERFVYVYSKDYAHHLDGMVNKVIDDWSLPENKTQVVAAAFATDADSSHAILQDLKRAFAKRHWHNFRDVSHLGKSTKHLAQYPMVVVVDEFIGSGQTMENRVSAIRNSFDQSMFSKQEPESYEIHVCVLACMNEGRIHLEKLGVKLHSELILHKGISDYLDGDALESAVLRMERLESTLAPHCNGKDLPSFGYSRSESLYSKENGNTPNNVFPILWWPARKNGTLRKTLLHRREAVS